MYSDFRTKLMSLADDEYREFSMRGIFCERPFLGVRLPDIRKLIANIPPEQFDEFLGVVPIAIEEVLARGFLIAKLPYDRMLEYFDSQISYLDNWCTVDAFCAALRKTVKKHENEFLEYKVESLLCSKTEFSTRAGVVFLLDFYVKREYLELIFDWIESLSGREEYYVRMALAWLVAECFIELPDETYDYLRRSSLNKWTFNKAISKICDSRRVEDGMKDLVREIRRI
ncbi:MAG: DNA alkylation repair protein [Candidatus Saccharibacteria bacterium]|nr:DNA alkylation repair protein [Candidatus Saccharibacteria bacterium]